MLRKVIFESDSRKSGTVSLSIAKGGEGIEIKGKLDLLAQISFQFINHRLVNRSAKNFGELSVVC